MSDPGKTDPPSAASCDFFVSYTGKDKTWAEWIAWQLEHAGYSVLIQAWDFKSGGVFPGDMHRALQQSARVLAVLSPDYMASAFCLPEWQAAFADDPTGEKGKLVCLRITDFKPDGLLRGRTYIDLVDLSEADARDRLLERLKPGRAKPATAPAFPTAAAPPPSFPGTSAPSPRPSSFELRPLATAIPHNLPRLQPFFGREDELKKIAAALDPEDRTWGALIDGPGGMGKTSLAVRAAYDAPAAHFDAIHFVSLKSRELDDDGIRDLSGFLISGLAELLNELARLLGREDIPRASEAERPRLLLEALRGTRALLILDNLESLTRSERDTLFTFIKRLPHGCKAILTARGRIGSGAEELILQKFSQDAALDTLAELATHNPTLAATSEAERIALYEQTTGSPLLLRWTAGQLGRGHCLTIEHAIAHLRSCPPGNDPLEFIFGDLVEDFTAQETTALCALTWFTQQVKVDHIATITGLTAQDTALALRALATRSLAVPDRELTAYTLVPLVADFLRKARPAVIEETGDRLEDHAYTLIMANGAKQFDRFPILEAAWPSIAPAIPLFFNAENERIQSVCSTLTHFLNFSGRWDERIALCQQAEAKALAAGDLKQAGWRAQQLGYVQYLRGEAAAVIACASRAEEHWAAAAGKRELAIAIRLRGLGYRLQADYPAAIYALRHALELDRSLDPASQDVAISLNALAEAERLSGNHDAAEAACREALEIARALTYAEGIATYTGNLADVALDRKDWAAAHDLATQAMPLAEHLGRQELIASNACRLAKALLGQGRPAAAHPFASQAAGIYEKLRHPDHSEALHLLTTCEASLEKPHARLHSSP